MRRNGVLLVLVVGLALGTAGLAVVAADGPGHGTMKVEGEILDMACYVAHEAKGPDHAACAKRCVKGGQPMGLLAEDGTVYLLYAGHKDGSAYEAAKELAGQKVELEGAMAERAGVKGIEVRGVKAL